MLSKMLVPIHIWRSTGDFINAKEFYNEYSTVDESYIKIHDYIIEDSISIRRSLQHNVILSENGSITVKKYSASFEGIIESFIDRYIKNFQSLPM